MPEPKERLARSAETGLRRFVKLAALLLWIPVGLFYWLPFLLRRTVNYVFVVLYAGLTGGDSEHYEDRWAEAISFYQVGFRRIVHAFDAGEPPSDDDDAGRGPAGARARAGRRRIAMPARTPYRPGRQFLLESVWACLVWGLLLWLTGIWPDAPQAVQAATLDAWELLVQAVLQVEAWIRGLLGR